MTATLRIPSADAREATYLNPGAEIPGGFQVVAQLDHGDGRWTSHHQLVIKDAAGNHYSADYQVGLTEYQDTRPFDEGDEAVFYPVTPVTRVVTVTDYVPTLKEAA